MMPADWPFPSTLIHMYRDFRWTFHVKDWYHHALLKTAEKRSDKSTVRPSWINREGMARKKRACMGDDHHPINER
ncbi:hypothetical protein EBZ35_05235 [bacterium]|nr:hypothetical protein [bacterium]